MANAFVDAFRWAWGWWSGAEIVPPIVRRRVVLRRTQAADINLRRAQPVDINLRHRQPLRTDLEG